MKGVNTNLMSACCSSSNGGGEVQTGTAKGGAVVPERHSRDVFHAWMLEGATYAGRLDMPRLRGSSSIPNRLVSFSDAMRSGWRDFDCWVHFFEDDADINRFWNNPRHYIGKLRKFRGVIGPDYSVGWNFPAALKESNHFRNSVCCHWLSRQGLDVIPQARCEGDDYMDVLAGFPLHSTLAIGARCMVRDIEDRAVLKESVKLVVDFLKPSRIVWYGSTMYGVTDYLKQANVEFDVHPGKGKGQAFF